MVALKATATCTRALKSHWPVNSSVRVAQSAINVSSPLVTADFSVVAAVLLPRSNRLFSQSSTKVIRKFPFY